MTENMKAFMDALKNNEELGKKFEEITDRAQAEEKDVTDEIIALAKDCGITLTARDFDLDEEELSDDELENVSGGLTVPLVMARQMLDSCKKHEQYRKQVESQKSQSQGQGTQTTEDQN